MPDRQAAAVNRRHPIAPAVLVPKPQVGNGQRAPRSTDPVTTLFVVRVVRVFRRRHLPAPRRHDCIGYRHGADRATGEAHTMAAVSSTERPRTRFDAMACTIDRSTQMKRTSMSCTRLMSDRSSACRHAPGDIEIAIGLCKPARRLDGNYVSESAAIDRRFRANDQRIVPAVMTDEQRHDEAAAASSERASANVVAIGFSISTGMPAHGRHAVLEMMAFGVATIRPSISAVAMSSASVSKDCERRCRSRNPAPRGPDRDAGRSASSRIQPMCLRPIRPAPASRSARRLDTGTRRA